MFKNFQRSGRNGANKEAQGANARSNNTKINFGGGQPKNQKIDNKLHDGGNEGLYNFEKKFRRGNNNQNPAQSRQNPKSQIEAYLATFELEGSDNTKKFQPNYILANPKNQESKQKTILRIGTPEDWLNGFQNLKSIQDWPEGIVEYGIYEKDRETMLAVKKNQASNIARISNYNPKRHSESTLLLSLSFLLFEFKSAIFLIFLLF